MEGAVIGKVTNEELEQLKGFKRRDDAIYKVIEKLVAQQHQLEVEQEHWFLNLRAQHNINIETGITVKHDTGEIIQAT